jgi:hypothetical protein
MQSDLYTGSNSGSFKNYRATKLKKELAEDKIVKQSKLTPAYELIHEQIEREISKVQSIEYLMVESITPEKDLVSELTARRKYVQFLKLLDSGIKNILKEQK